MVSSYWYRNLTVRNGVLAIYNILPCLIKKIISLTLFVRSSIFSILTVFVRSRMSSILTVFVRSSNFWQLTLTLIDTLRSFQWFQTIDYELHFCSAEETLNTCFLALQTRGFYIPSFLDSSCIPLRCSVNKRLYKLSFLLCWRKAFLYAILLCWREAFLYAFLLCWQEAFLYVFLLCWREAFLYAFIRIAHVSPDSDSSCIHWLGWFKYSLVWIDQVPTDKDSSCTHWLG